MARYNYAELYYALQESVKLQSHYADLLNMYDNGQRLKFETAEEWLLRLRKNFEEAKNIYGTEK